MNKLILIGNGFDKAHGLPTSYGDFIDDFWTNIQSNYKKEEFKKLITIDELNSNFFSYKKIKNFDDFYTSLLEHCINYNHKVDRTDKYLIKVNGKPNKYLFSFTNDLFKKITTESIEKWVDIENEYYSELKKIVKEEDLQTTRKTKDFLVEKKIKILKLNLEFEQIKELLKVYLQEKVINKYDFNNFSNERTNSFYKFLKLKHYGEHEEYLEEFSFIEDRETTKNLLREISKGSNYERELLILNFNYTPTIKNHLKRFDYSNIINIHGDLSNMVFGFGDETDNDYELIENMNDNEYLKNFKSFKYSLNSNYDNLFSFIESGKYQIYIMGHSCGLSDRVLLNSIFEHKNCRSIKIFYHEKENGKDNYSNIVQNISRHFNDKAMMRRKIVNKTLCCPLPQDVRLREK